MIEDISTGKMIEIVMTDLNTCPFCFKDGVQGTIALGEWESDSLEGTATYTTSCERCGRKFTENWMCNDRVCDTNKLDSERIARYDKGNKEGIN